MNSVINLTSCCCRCAVVKTRAVKAVGEKRRVVLVTTKDCNVQNIAHVRRRTFDAKTRHHHPPNTGLNAFERHAFAVEEAKREITVNHIS